MTTPLRSNFQVTRVFYASGKQAWRRDARADGKDGLMARGFYAVTLNGETFGPATTERKARDLAGAAQKAENMRHYGF